MLPQEVSSQGYREVIRGWLLTLCLTLQYFVTLVLTVGAYHHYDIVSHHILKTAQMRNGMSVQEVEAIMGEPTAREMVRSEDGTTWTTESLTYFWGTGAPIYCYFDANERLTRVSTLRLWMAEVSQFALILLVVIATRYALVVPSRWRAALWLLDVATASVFGGIVALEGLVGPRRFWELRWVLLVPLMLCVLSVLFLLRGSLVAPKENP
ncbi:MAG: outer membrane protein assembly factor BamE [Firmicutes bacterium]|nr:outer membrane protein assembly factor BamE [Bacillota bacterium]